VKLSKYLVVLREEYVILIHDKQSELRHISVTTEQLCGNRTRNFNTTGTKAPHLARSWGSSYTYFHQIQLIN